MMMYCARCGTKTNEKQFADWDRGVCTGCAEDELEIRTDAEEEYGEKEELMFDSSDGKEEAFYGLYFRDDVAGEIEVLDCHSNFLGSILSDEMGRFYFSCPPDTGSRLTAWNLLGVAGYLQEWNETCP